MENEGEKDTKRIESKREKQGGWGIRAYINRTSVGGKSEQKELYRRAFLNLFVSFETVIDDMDAHGMREKSRWE